MKKSFFAFVGFLSCLLFFSFSGCKRPNFFGKADAVIAPQVVSPTLTEGDLAKMSKEEIVSYLRKKSIQPVESSEPIVDMSKSLSFEVYNKIGQKRFVTCFYWMKNKPEARWRWAKTKIYEVENNAVQNIILETIPDSRDRAWTFGFLGVFDDKREADRATFERVDKKKLIDLDLLSLLKNRRVSLVVKKYGLEGSQVFYEKESARESGIQSAEGLDFWVKNQTDKEIYATCFIYEQPNLESDYSLWRYQKGSVLELNPGETKKMVIPPVDSEYKRSYMRGVLGIFPKGEKKVSQDSTFELTEPDNKLNLGLLSSVRGKVISVRAEKYGIFEDVLDYEVKDSSKFFNKRSGKWEPINNYRE